MTKEREKAIAQLGRQCRIACDMLELYCPCKKEFVDELRDNLKQISGIIHYYYENDYDKARGQDDI